MITNATTELLQPSLAGKGLTGHHKAKEGPESRPKDVARLDRFDPTPSTAPEGNQVFGLRFRHLSIRRELAVLRSSRSPVSSEPAVQTDPPASSADLVQVQRRTEMDLFFARTQALSVGMEPARADQLGATSQSVGRTFEVSISLEASFLHQFAGQAETLSSADQGLFDHYLSTTDQMVGLSGEVAQGFFDMVSQALEETRSAVMDGLEGFLNQAGSSLGLEGDALNNFKSQVASQVAGFFVDLGKFIQESRARLGPPPKAPVQPGAAEAPVSVAGTSAGLAET